MDPAMLTARYRGRPFARLLDASVIDTVGMLDERTASGMAAMAPKLRSTFGMSTGSCQDVVRAQMDIDAGFEQCGSAARTRSSSRSTPSPGSRTPSSRGRTP